jgi:hypothetical protein
MSIYFNKTHFNKGNYFSRSKLQVLQSLLGEHVHPVHEYFTSNNHLPSSFTTPQEEALKEVLRKRQLVAVESTALRCEFKFIYSEEITLCVTTMYFEEFWK